MNELEISKATIGRMPLYLRFLQEENSRGEKYISSAVIAQNIPVSAVLVRKDLALVSSKPGKPRLGFEVVRLIADIEAKKVNMVITKALSRLGRDYIMTGHYMERYFPEHRVRYISLLDGIDTGVDSTANDITPFRAIMNDMYSIVTPWPHGKKDV